MTGPFSPAAEAFERLGGAYDVRVLEPSPPAVVSAPYYADDPTAPGRARGARPLVSPVSGADLLWGDLVRDDPGLASFCADRWLAAHRPVAALPAGWENTVTGLHRIARDVVASVRARAYGHQTGLRWVRGGFGTPFFGSDTQIRVQGDVLTIEFGDGRRAEGRITSVAGAAEFCGFDLTRFDTMIDREDLAIDRGAGLALGEWLGFATSVLEELRARRRETPGTDVSRVQLWPERFELAFDVAGPAGRLTAGASCAEPCLWVSDWLGGEPGRRRAALAHAELCGVADARGDALAFFEDAQK